ncbi:hypothetical protein [Chitinophaga sp. Ak27]|uniref:hypothetical protein n=1 Tax=Chitinophaga sp. Ak27 TaxID=2726116 RepID=UPI00145F0F28|nr:hypothetical protein [Chitinophaga sp. Ak27]NLU93863.1 hypothetical protein [Chitinophaga sp. Ak27]
MTRICTMLILSVILLTACSLSKDKGPCDGIICDNGPLTFYFKLVDPNTGHDLVYGDHAIIPLDSVRNHVKYQAIDTLVRVKQVIDPVRKRAYMIFMMTGGPQSLRVGTPGKAIQYKVDVKTKSAGCCGSLVSDVLLNDNPAPITRDSTGIYLIPYKL